MANQNENEIDEFDFADLNEQELNNIEEDLNDKLAHELQALENVNTGLQSIQNPDALGKVILDEVWTQFGNQIGLEITSETLIQQYGGVLPSDKDELQKLPGVGNKSAGVIRAEVFKIPDLPVDTHILRISKRLKLAKEKDGPFETEMKLKKSFPESSWIKIHHQLIHFGRDICVARKPQCQRCKLAGICSNFKI